MIVLLFTHFVYLTAPITTHRFSFTIHSTSIQALGVDIAAFSAMPNESEVMVQWVVIHYLHFVQLTSVPLPPNFGNGTADCVCVSYGNCCDLFD